MKNIQEEIQVLFEDHKKEKNVKEVGLFDILLCASGLFKK